MFSVVKVRDGLARDDYRDPGWYSHPPGTVAYEFTGEPPPAARAEPPASPGRLLAARKTRGGHRAH